MELQGFKGLDFNFKETTMKNLTRLIALCVLALTPFGVKAQGVTHNSFDGTGAVVSRRQVHTFVKNGTSDTYAIGSAVCYSTSSDDGITVGDCSSDGEFGACMIDESCAAGAMCKCLVEGFTEALVYNGAGDDSTAGEFVYVGSEGTFEALHSPTHKDKPVGVFLDSTGTSGSVQAYLKF